MIDEFDLYVCDTCEMVATGNEGQACIGCGHPMIKRTFVRSEKSAGFILANIAVARINATLIDFVTEVAQAPYNDSAPASLLETLRVRAAAVLKNIEDEG